MAVFERITEHVLRLEVPFRAIGPVVVPVSIWLIDEGGSWTLVDAGPPEAADQVVAAVRLTTDDQSVRRILLTHAHYDHAGGLDALRQAWNPAVVCHREEVPFVTGGQSYRRQRARAAAFWFGRFFMRAKRWRIPVARDLEAGQSADGMVVIHLPGHTPGHIGLLHVHDGAMICGDAVMNLRGRLSPPFASATPDPGAAEASMLRLGEIDFQHLLPSHGPPILGRGREAILDLLERRGTTEVASGQW
ncbi:MAG TPA: MBL fold metallo-hydrolase [Anaerolineales bacterium]|nr:MBL fold metallo-hydrolase [Anaerolineales bacterium]